MGSIFEDFVQGQKHRSGPVIAASLAPVATARCPDRLLSFHYFSNPARLSQDLRYALFQSSEFKLSKSEQNAWIDVFSVYWKAVGELLLFNEQPPRGSWVNVFNAWKEVAIALIRAYQNNVLPYWTVPCLYMVGKFLRIFGIKADAELLSQNSVAVGGNFDDTEEESGKESKLKDSALVINRMFSLCLSDRAPLEESRKWAVYKMTNLLFKAYFRINAVSLSENTLKVLGASSDIPPLEAFPKSHVVTFKYYLGVISFLQEHYAEAEEHLASARQLCHKDATKNRELILMYLVCCHIVTTHTLPSKALLANFPRLEALFRPLCDCIRKGDLGGFDTAMAAGEEVFVKRRIYLPLERSRDIALRNLFRKVFIAGGFDEPKDDKPALRRTRISVNEFAAAVRIGTHADSKTRVDTDEVECLLSNLIYKGLMKGYISRERGMVVLSNKGDAFPGTGV